MRDPSLYLICMACLLALVAPPGAAEPTRVLDVWPGKAPGEDGSIGSETFQDQKPGEKPVKRLTNVTHPTLSVFRPARDRDTGAAVVICPGGGYSILAWDLEGEEVASWLNSIGVTGIVLKYRVPRRKSQQGNLPQLQDAQRALSLVRSKADEWGLNSNRIGILGFSAGGHLAASLATHFDERAYTAVDEIDKISCRPDFAVLIYPGGMDKKNDPTSPIAHVSSTTPPMFLAHAGDDAVSPRNSVEMYLALLSAKVPAELHIYASGATGSDFEPPNIPAPPGQSDARNGCATRESSPELPHGRDRGVVRLCASLSDNNILNENKHCVADLGVRCVVKFGFRQF